MTHELTTAGEIILNGEVYDGDEGLLCKEQFKCRGRCGSLFHYKYTVNEWVEYAGSKYYKELYLMEKIIPNICYTEDVWYGLIWSNFKVPFIGNLRKIKMAAKTDSSRRILNE